MALAAPVVKSSTLYLLLCVIRNWSLSSESNVVKDGCESGKHFKSLKLWRFLKVINHPTTSYIPRYTLISSLILEICSSTTYFRNSVEKIKCNLCQSALAWRKQILIDLFFFFCYTTEHIHWLVALIVAAASKKSQFRKEVNAGQQKFFL